METKLNNRNIVKTSHELNHFRGGYTPLELDFIYAFISCIKNEDDELKSYELELSDLEKKLDTRLRLDRIEKIFDSLVTKSFKINNAKELTVYAFFSRFSYNKESKKISVKFNPDLKPHLIKLKTYAMGNLRYILSLRGEYSKRLYMLLAQWRTAGTVTYTVEQLREMLAFPKSYKYANIKIMINKAQKDLKNKSPFVFEYEEHKKGKAVHEITFTIYGNNKDVEEFRELIRNDYHDLNLLEIDGKMIKCDTDGKLYYIHDIDLEKKFFTKKYEDACWKRLHQTKDRLPIFTTPSLFDYTA